MRNSENIGYIVLGTVRLKFLIRSVTVHVFNWLKRKNVLPENMQRKFW